MMEAPAGTGATTQKLRVHVQRRAGSQEFFHVSEQSFEEALARHPAIATSIAVTFGSTHADLVSNLATAEVLLTGNLEACKLRAVAPPLRWVQSIHAGVEQLAPLIPSGVTLTNASGVDARKAGEFVIGALILLNVALPRFIAQQAEACWKPIFTSSLAGKTVLLLGTGSLGRAVASEARHFGMTVLGVSRTGRALPGFDSCDTPDALSHLLPRATFLVVTLPSAPGTRGLIGRCELDLLPPSAGIVNIGRADIMDYRALTEKLTAGELAGAVLDVFGTEPLAADSPFWTVPNLIVTPHCAIDDAANYIPSLLDLFFDNLGRYVANRPLRNVVDLVLGY